MFRRTTFHITCFAALALTACQSPPQPLALPAATLSVSYERLASATDAEPIAARTARPPVAAAGRTIELLAIAEQPTGTPVALAAAAIVSDRGTPFRGKSQLPIGSRWLSLADTESWLKGRAQRLDSQQQELGKVAAVLHPQLVTMVQVATATESKPGAQTVKVPALRLQTTQGGWQASLYSTAAKSKDGPNNQAETVVIAEAIGADEAVALFLPDARVPGGGLLLLVLPEAAPSDEAIAAATASAQKMPPSDDTTTPLPPAWRVAHEAIGERNRRPALLAVAAPFRLTRVTDLIVSADEPALIAMTQQLTRVDARSDKVGWLLEIAIWQALLPRMERNELSPPLQAACTRHLGAIADDPSTLLLLLKTFRDGNAFVSGLIEENLAALADRSPAVRLAAVRWLTSQQITVTGYDPMAPKSERRHALRQFLTAREAGQ